MKQSLRNKLIQELQKSNLLTEKQIEKAVEIQKKKGGNLGEILVSSDFISREDLMLILSQQLSIPPIDLNKYKITPSVVKLIPEKVAKQYKLIPLSILGNRITIAMSDPTNIFAIDDVKALTKYEIDLVIAVESDIDNAIAAYYGGSQDADIAKIIEQDHPVEELEIVDDEEKIDISQVTAESKKAPIVKIVSMMLNEALNRRASDIHIEPQDKTLRVRFRIDGKLQEAFSLPKGNQNAVIARLKIMSVLDITETRMPQDGRFKIKYQDREIDFRVSVLPIAHGNKIVLRALDSSSLSVGLDKMGFLKEPLNNFTRALDMPYGMILITGPTGSGKSTTLYSILNKMNTVKKNIVTIEDPVEYHLDGITQVQANSEIGLNFASGLKSILRQSPDVVMVGEIRDFETADIAIKASLTGQLVLSTLHTNDAPSAVTRLVDMGVEPFLIASSVVMTAAQRLCRKLCPHCKQKYGLNQKVVDRLKVAPDLISEIKKNKEVYGPKGCKKCNNTGYLGRMGTLETFIVDDNIRQMIIDRASADEIKKYAVKKGMSTLRENALIKFKNGLTSLEEVLRITTDE